MISGYSELAAASHLVRVPPKCESFPLLRPTTNNAVWGRSPAAAADHLSSKPPTDRIMMAVGVKDMSGHKTRIGILFAGALLCAHAQWLNYPLPGTPRMRDGKVNL